MAYKKLIHYIVNEVKKLISKKQINLDKYKFQKTSHGNLRITDRDTDKKYIV